jgi:hypothetical protein
MKQRFLNKYPATASFSRESLSLNHIYYDKYKWLQMFIALKNLEYTFLSLILTFMLYIERPSMESETSFQTLNSN